MESQPQNPELRINPENFHPCVWVISDKLYLLVHFHYIWLISFRFTILTLMMKTTSLIKMFSCTKKEKSGISAHPPSTKVSSQQSITKVCMHL